MDISFFGSRFPKKYIPRSTFHRIRKWDRRFGRSDRVTPICNKHGPSSIPYTGRLVEQTVETVEPNLQKKKKRVSERDPRSTHRLGGWQKVRA
jgi:hypothetical protein